MGNLIPFIPFMYFTKQRLIDVSDSLPSLAYIMSLLFIIFIPFYGPCPSLSLWVTPINKPPTLFLFLLLQQPHRHSESGPYNFAVQVKLTLYCVCSYTNT